MTDSTRSMPPAGWYTDPGNPGGERWFDGTIWTEFRKATAAALPPTATPPVVAERAAPVAAPAANAAQPFAYLPATAAAAVTTPATSAQPVVWAPVPSAAAPKSKTAAAKDGLASFTANPTVQGVGIGAVGAALAAAGTVGIGTRKGIASDAKLLLVGLIIAVVGLIGTIGGIGAAVDHFTRTTTSGTVTDIRKENFWFPVSDCIPTVKFAVDGSSHQFRPTDFDDCTWAVGDTVTISYKAGTAGAGAQMATNSTIVADTIIPGILIPGTLILIGFAVTGWVLTRLALKAGSIAAGLALIRQGWKHSKRDIRD